MRRRHFTLRRPPEADRARYDGLAVDFLAESITAIGARDTHGFHSYNLASPHDDGISLNNFVDWLIEAGCRIERIDRYDVWLSRFNTAMRALPEGQRQQSMLVILEPYSRPQTPGPKSMLSARKFRAALQASGFDIPHLSSALIRKYVADQLHLRLL